MVKVLADAGFTKAKVKQHFYENAKLWVDNLSGMIVQRFYKGIAAGNWPEQLGTSTDLERYIQMVSCPDDFMVVVSGDPDRDHVLICSQNGWIGYPVSKKISLPSNWDALRKLG